MKAAGATTVGGLMITGTTTATAPSECNCERGFLGSRSACLTGRIGCTYCKIDSGDLPSVGDTCSVEGTDSATIERTSDQCIEFSDPEDELCKIALKAVSGQGSCTVKNAAGDTSGSLCTDNGRGISNVQFEFHCEDCPGERPGGGGEEGCTYENDAIASTSFDCDEVSAELTGVEGDCPVQLRLTFVEGTSECDDVVVEDVTTNSPDPIDVPECCTPEALYLEDPQGDVNDSADSEFDEARCVNENLDGDDFDVEFCRDRVTVTVINEEDLECPVTATLNLDGDDCAGPTMEEELSPENLEAEFTIEGCDCTPASVDVNGFSLEPDEELDCVCDDFEAHCKIGEEDLFTEDGEGKSDIECDGITIDVTETRTKDDGDVTCFRFTSSEPIYKVFVKGGGGRNASETYEFPCGTTDSSEDGGMLCANTHPRSGRQTGVSHVTFYVCADDLDYC